MSNEKEDTNEHGGHEALMERMERWGLESRVISREAIEEIVRTNGNIDIEEVIKLSPKTPPGKLSKPRRR